MSDYITGECADLFDNTTGAWRGVIDRRGREQIMASADGSPVSGAGVSDGAFPINPTPVTASRALTAADFGAGILVLNSAGVIAITVPTVAAMSLPATAGKVRTLPIYVTGGGIPTFAGATSATSINGTAGPSTAAPLGGAPVTGIHLVLTQQAVGADLWSLE